MARVDFWNCLVKQKLVGRLYFSAQIVYAVHVGNANIDLNKYVDFVQMPNLVTMALNFLPCGLYLSSKVFD